MIQIVGSLASEHMIGILGLAERIVYTAPIRIGMIAALMVKRMPLGSADKFSCGMIQSVIGLCKGESLNLHRTLTPTSRSTVVIVMGVPVIDILTPFACKNILTRGIGFLIIAGPAVYKVIILLHSCRMDICGSNWPTGIRILILSDLKSLKREVFRIAGLVENRFPHQDTWMISITTDYLTRILMNVFGKLRVLVPILPSGSRNNHKHT